MRVTSVAAILVLLVWGAGCQSTPGDGSFDEQRESRVGSGSIELQEPALQEFMAYLQTVKPLAFAVTVDGADGTGAYCPIDILNACGNFRDMDVIFSCEREHDAPCKLFARGRTIVWSDPGQWAGDNRLGNYVAAAMSLEPASYPIEIVWGNEVGAGFMAREPDAELGHITISLDPSAPCHGEIHFDGSSNSGSWGLICRGGVTAQGQIQPAPEAAGSEEIEILMFATGVDTSGAPVAFKIYPELES